MKLIEKTELYSRGNKHFTGRYKNHKIDIEYISYNPFVENLTHYWYFSCENLKTNNNYNSLCDKLKFKTQQECVDAATKYIDENLKPKEE